MFFGDYQRRPPLRDPHYLGWVRTLPCCGCGRPPTSDTLNDAHHCIANRHGSSKASDLHALPLCRDCHAKLHAGWREWEDEHGSQWHFAAMVLEEAHRRGLFGEFDRYAARCE